MVPTLRLFLTALAIPMSTGTATPRQGRSATLPRPIAPPNMLGASQSLLPARHALLSPQERRLLLTFSDLGAPSPHSMWWHLSRAMPAELLQTPLLIQRLFDRR